MQNKPACDTQNLTRVKWNQKYCVPSKSTVVPSWTVKHRCCMVLIQTECMKEPKRFSKLLDISHYPPGTHAERSALGHLAS